MRNAGHRCFQHERIIQNASCREDGRFRFGNDACVRSDTEVSKHHERFRLVELPDVAKLGTPVFDCLVRHVGWGRFGAQQKVAVRKQCPHADQKSRHAVYDRKTCVCCGYDEWVAAGPLSRRNKRHGFTGFGVRPLHVIDIA